MESVIAIITSTQFPGHNDQHSIIEKLPGKTVLSRESQNGSNLGNNLSSIGQVTSASLANRHPLSLCLKISHEGASTSFQTILIYC